MFQGASLTPYRIFNENSLRKLQGKPLIYNTIRFDRLRGSTQTMFKHIIMFRWGVRGCAVFCNNSWVSVVATLKFFGLGTAVFCLWEAACAPLFLALLSSPWLGYSYGSAFSIACCVLSFHRIIELKDSLVKLKKQNFFPPKVPKPKKNRKRTMKNIFLDLK